MKVIFQTSNLNKTLYAKLVIHYFLSQIPISDRNRFLREMKNYQVIFRPSTMASEDPFFHGKDGVGGVTDAQKMIIYVIDTNENPKDTVQRVLRTNANVVSHEGGHALLLWAGMIQRVPLRHDDFSGHKAGTVLSFATAEVHDRDYENDSFYMDLKVFITKYLKFFSYKVKVLDFRDILD